MITLAVSTYSLLQHRRQHGRSVADCLDWLADRGVEAVEFAGLSDAPLDKPVPEARKLRRRCDKLGLRVAGYCVGAELLVPEAAQRQAVERLRREVDAAAELGCASMRHDITRGWGDHASDLSGARTFARALKVVVPAIRAVADHGADRGVVTSFENHGFYLQRPDRVAALLDAADHPNFRLTLDMGNFLCVNADPVDAVRRLARRAVMAHVKDFHVKSLRQSPGAGWFNTPAGIALRGAIVGHGAIDVPAQLRLLRKAKYHGFLSLEFEGLEDAPRAVEMGLDYLRRQLA